MNEQPSTEPPGFSRYRERAAQLVKEPKRVLKLLTEVPEKLRQHPRVTYLGSRISVASRLLRAWVRGEYTAVPHATIVALLAALIYFVFILDLIPDFLFWIGLLDDASVLTYVLTRFNKDLESFEAWDSTQSQAKEAQQIVDKSLDNP